MDDGVAPKELTQFRILAKSSVGKGCVMLIQRILSSPAVWVFGEILAMPNVADLRGTEHEPSLRLLEIFAYGTYSDYIAQQAQLKLPALRPQDVSKLRMLSIVALAQKQPTISYSTLQRELDISNVRQLEDLIFETIYAGLIQAKLDQRAGVLKVSYAIARDVRLEDVDGLLQKLGAWSSAADEMLDALEVGVASAKQDMYRENKRQEAVKAKADEVRAKSKDTDMDVDAYEDHHAEMGRSKRSFRNKRVRDGRPRK